MSADEDRLTTAAEMLLCAGYLLGQLDGLALEADMEILGTEISLQGHLTVSNVLGRLRDVLRTLWETKEEWISIEVFAPIYDLIVA